VIARDPNHAAAHYNLGVALKNKDEIDELKRSSLGARD